MGFDKARLNFHGVDQVTWLNNLLGAYCEKVFVSGSPEKIKGEFNFIEDIYDRGGLMNGILSAFKKYPNNSWLVLPVDMPNIDSMVIEFLIKHHDSSKYATYFISQSNRIEPLPVLLESKSYPVLLKEFLNYEESLYSFLERKPSNQIVAINEKWLINKNYPD
jgi:molybdopterin-guanine dinucleotide biosynthesis protein A